MAVAGSTTVPQNPAGTVQAEQVYVTHCAPEDAFTHGQAGFAVRASSAGEPTLLRFALEYAPYELPLELWNVTPTPAEAPRRLALVGAPDGRAALIHSAHVEEDTMGRKNSYFTHVLLYDALTPAEALRTWGSADWRVNYPRGAERHLPRFAGLPRAGPINDQAVTNFLAARPRAPDQALATLVCPDRLRDDPVRRRDLVLWTVRGLLLAPEGGARERLYLHAEPGLTALLLYAAVRLLPPSAVRGVCFSTYEPAHRALREFKRGAAAGTYAPKKGLDRDYFNRRGYAVDTFGPVPCSAELSDPVPVIEELIELAAGGRWAEIDELHRLCRDGPPVAALTEAAELVGCARRLATGRAQLADVLTLRGSEPGAALLRQHEGRVWPLIRDASLTNAGVRTTFAPQLRERYQELIDWAVEALAAGAVADWQPRWGLLKQVAGSDRPTLHSWLLGSLTRLDQRGALATHRARLRLPLLREWQAHAPPGPVLPAVVSGLLHPQTAGELEQLVQGRFPDEWLVPALRAALPQPATREAAARAVRGADGRLLAAFCSDVSRLSRAQDQLAVLAPLLPPGDPEAPRFYGRLTAAGLPLPDATRHALLEQAAAFDDSWLPFWLTGAALTDLLTSAEGGPASERLWDVFCGKLNGAVLRGDSTARRLLECLRRARDSLGEKTPPRCDQAVTDWTLLCDVFRGPAAPPAAVLAGVCARRGVTSEELLGDHFNRVVRKQEFGDTAVEPFHDLFTAFHPRARLDDARGQKDRFCRWLDVIAGCDDARLAALYQAHYVTHYVPYSLRRGLAEECQKEGRLQALAYKHIINFKPPEAQPAIAPRVVAVPATLPYASPPAGAAGHEAGAGLRGTLATWKERGWLVPAAAGAAVGLVIVVTAVLLLGWLRGDRKPTTELTQTGAGDGGRGQAPGGEVAGNAGRGGAIEKPPVVAEAEAAHPAEIAQFKDLVAITAGGLKDHFEAVKERLPANKESEWRDAVDEQQRRIDALQATLTGLDRIRTKAELDTTREVTLDKLKAARTANLDLKNRATANAPTNEEAEFLWNLVNEVVTGLEAHIKATGGRLPVKDESKQEVPDPLGPLKRLRESLAAAKTSKIPVKADTKTRVITEITAVLKNPAVVAPNDSGAKQRRSLYEKQGVDAWKRNGRSFIYDVFQKQVEERCALTTNESTDLKKLLIVLHDPGRHWTGADERAAAAPHVQNMISELTDFLVVRIGISEKLTEPKFDKAEVAACRRALRDLLEGPLVVTDLEGLIKDGKLSRKEFDDAKRRLLDTLK